MRRALAILVVLALASCSDQARKRPPSNRTSHPARVEHKKARHGSHDHNHGGHPHAGDAHHHHPHPHPHLDGVKGHHHPY